MTSLTGLDVNEMDEDDLEAERKKFAEGDLRSHLLSSLLLLQSFFVSIISSMPSRNYMHPFKLNGPSFFQNFF